MHKLNVMIDGYNLALETGTGIATYARNLSYAVTSLGHQVNILYGKRIPIHKKALLKEIAFFDAAKPGDKNWFYYLKAYRDALLSPLGCRTDSIPMTGQVIYESFKKSMPSFDQILNSPELYLRSQRTFRWFNQFAQVKLSGIDIAHWTYPLPLRIPKAINIYTLHDLVPLRLPHTTLDNKRRYYSLCKKIAKTADHIITVSETSRNDIINLLGVSPEKVTNTYQAVTLPQLGLEENLTDFQHQLRNTFNLEYKKYFLFYGAIEPKKNIARLIEAYLASQTSTPLIIVGAPGWKEENELKLLIASKNLNQESSKKISRIEYLPFPMLLNLIRGAKATLFPSLYEGFGLPVLESMALGTAVITSNVSSLPEIAGDAAYLVNPYNTCELVQAIQELDKNDILRFQLEDKGRQQAKKFSQEAYKNRLADLYQNLIHKRYS